MEKLLEAEMTNHLGHERRKGASSRPYGPGMSTRDIQAHLRELYGTDLSHELISQATEGVLELFREWRSRPLYPIVYLDALCVSTRDAGQVTKRAFYIALGVSALLMMRHIFGATTPEDLGHLLCRPALPVLTVHKYGSGPVLGRLRIWLELFGGSEWMMRSALTAILDGNRLRGRSRMPAGARGVLRGGLTGFDKAVEAAFPKAVMQTCIVGWCARAALHRRQRGRRAAGAQIPITASVLPSPNPAETAPEPQKLGHSETPSGQPIKGG